MPGAGSGRAAAGQDDVAAAMNCDETIDDFLAAVLRGECVAWPDARSLPGSVDAMAARIRFHGVAPLLAERLAGRTDWPESLRDGIFEEARLQAFWEQSHRKAMRLLLERFAGDGIEAVVMKGTALAYSVYGEPAERRRGDTDLLVRERDLDAARSILEATGFAAAPPIIGLIFQESWQFDTDMGFVHTLDLHWRVADAPALHGAVGADECFARAVPLPGLAPGARAVDPVLTFIQCCINQALHVGQGYRVEGRKIFGGNRLGWARDNDLLLCGFSAGQWRNLLQVCRERGLGPVCLAGVRLAQRAFGTVLPEGTLDELAAMGANSAAARYLQQTDDLGRFLCNVDQSPGLRGKLRYIASYVFPDRSRLGLLYPESKGAPLFLLQLRRLWSIALRRIGRLTT